MSILTPLPSSILRTTQRRVHRMLKAMAERSVEAESPEEIILHAAADGTPLVASWCGAWPKFHHTFRPRAPEPFEGAVSVTWDEVRPAFMTGLLSEGTRVPRPLHRANARGP